MSNIIPFSFEKFQVRVVTRDGGEPWFVAVDACAVLTIGNVSDATGRLDDDEKMTIDTTEGHSGQRGGAQSMTIINESGLYSLILTSRKPAAKRFKKWVTAEVLPSIRKTGAYLAPGVTLESLPPALASQIGGIIKAVVKKQNEELEIRVATGFALALAANRDEFDMRLREVMAGGGASIRFGRTSGQLWADYKLPAIKNASIWFGNRLTELGCRAVDEGCSESGGKKSKLFDPDKVAVAMKNGLLGYAKQYAQQRLGQVPLFPKVA